MYSRESLRAQYGSRFAAYQHLKQCYPGFKLSVVRWDDIVSTFNNPPESCEIKLAQAEARIAELEAELADLRTRYEVLEMAQLRERMAESLMNRLIHEDFNRHEAAELEEQYKQLSAQQQRVRFEALSIDELTQFLRVHGQKPRNRKRDHLVEAAMSIWERELESG
jgi:cysteinyl-tRNA synthetase